MIVANSYALQAELSDEKRFKKKVGTALQQVRHSRPRAPVSSHLMHIYTGPKLGRQWAFHGLGKHSHLAPDPALTLVLPGRQRGSRVGYSS